MSPGFTFASSAEFIEADSLTFNHPVGVSKISTKGLLSVAEGDDCFGSGVMVFVGALEGVEVIDGVAEGEAVGSGVGTISIVAIVRFRFNL